MQEAISELGKLCKAAAELERKWDLAGRDYLGTRMPRAEYKDFVRRYLDSVRRLEAALNHHLIALTGDTSQGGEVAMPELEADHRNPDA